MFRRSRRFWLIAAGAVALLIAAVLAIVFLVNQPRGPQQQLQTTEAYTATEGATTVNGVGSYSLLATPASSEWWERGLPYANRSDISALDYNSISSGLENVVYTMSAGDGYDDGLHFGLSSVFLSYGSVEDAEAAAEALPESLRHEVVGTYVLLMTDGAFSDSDYSLSALATLDGVESNEALQQGEAFWQLNVSDFQEVYEARMVDEDAAVSRRLFDMVGLSANTTWVGTSSDGLSWTGQLYDINFDGLATPSVIEEYLLAQTAYLRTDGSIGLDWRNIPESEIDSQAGIIYPRQSRVLDVTTFQSEEEASGTLSYSTREGVDAAYDEDASTPEPLSGGDGVLRVETSPNLLLGYLTGDTVADPATAFGFATITLMDLEGKADIELTPFSTDE